MNIRPGDWIEDKEVGCSDRIVLYQIMKVDYEKQRVYCRVYEVVNGIISEITHIFVKSSDMPYPPFPLGMFSRIYYEKVGLNDVLLRLI